MGQQPPHLAEHFVEQDRLHQVIVGAALERLDGVLDGGVGGDEQHERFRADPVQPLAAVCRPSMPGSCTSHRATSNAGCSAARASASSPLAQAATAKPSCVRYSARVSRISSSSSTTRMRTAAGDARPGGARRFYHDAPFLSAAARRWRAGLRRAYAARLADRRQRQADAEDRPLAGPRLEIDRAAVVGHQLPRHEQPQAGAVLLRREIGLEQPAGVLRRDAAAVVAHRHFDALRRSGSTARFDRGRRGPAASMALRIRLRNTCTSWSRTPNRGGRSGGSSGAAMRPRVRL